MIKTIIESIVDFMWIQARTLGLVKCNEHGWTYVIDDTESDSIECPFCHKWVRQGQPGFEELKQKVIHYKYGQFCRPADWTRDIEREVAEIVSRNIRGDPSTKPG